MASVAASEERAKLWKRGIAYLVDGVGAPPDDPRWPAILAEAPSARANFGIRGVADGLRPPPARRGTESCRWLSRMRGALSALASPPVPSEQGELFGDCLRPRGSLRAARAHPGPT